MTWIEAIILGILQGLTEYLPVSSSGHLAIGSALFGIEGEENLTFTIVVHVATVLSTLVILWKEIDWIFRGLFKFQMNEETKYVLNIIVSMIPVGIVGVFFKDYVEDIFSSGLLIVGIMLLVTASLLVFSYYAKPRTKEKISMKDAFIIGLAQACAVMPGLSRSGSTIATGLLLGNKKETLDSRFPCGLHFRMYSLQMDDKHRKERKTGLLRYLLCHSRCHNYSCIITQLKRSVCWILRKEKFYT